jgi:hypothetical protein
MAISHDGFQFFNHKHTLLTRASQPEPQVAIRTVFGVQGEFHITGERGGSDLSCIMFMDNYQLLVSLQNNLDIIQEKALKLTGDVSTSVAGTGIITFQDCTFLGAAPLGKPFYDGSGQHGWVQRILLQWRARSPNS